MAVDLATLMDEAKCLCGAGASDAQKATLALLQRIAEATAGQPKVYRALLTQTGVAAPVATILENTLGGTPVWSYIGTGNYNATLVGAFPSGKTFLLWADSTVDDISNTTIRVELKRLNANVLQLLVYDPGNAGANNELSQNSVQILVYP